MNHLYYGDNLKVLREAIPSASVDLIYLDPPFNTNASYNVLFKGPAGADSAAQIEAFDDTWHWNDSAEEASFASIDWIAMLPSHPYGSCLSKPNANGGIDENAV